MFKSAGSYRHDKLERARAKAARREAKAARRLDQLRQLQTPRMKNQKK
jgi:hypothetical protein